MPRSNPPRNAHLAPDLAEVAGLPAPTGGDVSERVDQEQKIPSSAEARPNAVWTRRLTVDISEETRRRFASAAALAGLNMKAALRTYADACARGDERALSLLHHPIPRAANDCVPPADGF
jgi:hypothetical protein